MIVNRNRGYGRGAAVGAAGLGYFLGSGQARNVYTLGKQIGRDLRVARDAYNKPVPVVNVTNKKQKVTFKPKKTLKAKVKQLESKMKSDQAYHTYKSTTTTQLLSTVNTVNYTTLTGVDMATMETAMANLRYYNPSAPGTLVTANAATGTYSRQVHFTSIYSGGTIVNNFQVPCEVKLYLCKVKGDTSITPTTYYSNGVTDQVISGSASNIDLYPTEIDVLKEQYNVKCYKSKLLQPGQSFKFSHSIKNIDYDPSLFDSHSLTYQTKYKNFVWMIRVNGVIGHDTAVAGEVGNLQAGIDIEQLIIHKITYDAGTNLNDIYISDTRDTFTNGGVVSNKPVSDNQSYSVS